MQFRRSIRTLAATFTALTLPFTANAGLIRDAEIEATLTSPINPQRVK